MKQKITVLVLVFALPIASTLSLPVPAPFFQSKNPPTAAGVQAPIVFLNQTNVFKSSPGTRFVTNTFNIPANNNSALLVFVAEETAGGAVQVSNVTYGGQLLTKMVQQVDDVDDAEYWMLLNPGSGNSNLIVNMNAPAVNNGMAASTWTNVLQSGQPNCITNYFTPNEQYSKSNIVTSAGYVMVVDGYLRRSGGGEVLNPLGGQTLIQTNEQSGSFSFASSYTNVISASTVAMQWTNSSASQYEWIMIGLKPMPP